MENLFLLNIKTAKIHNGIAPCPAVKKMGTENTKVFHSLDAAMNFFEGGKKGEICIRCRKNWSNSELEKRIGQ